MTDANLHPLDAMLALAPRAPGMYDGHTHASYWNMVGPYGGATAALLLHSILQHPKCLGEPVALTVNFAGPVAAGPYRIEATPVRTNRSTQHWTVTLLQEDEQGETQVTTTATAVTAVRRETFSIDDVPLPHMPTPESCERFDTTGAMEWLQRYDMRVVTGAIPQTWDDSAHEPVSQLWVRDNPPRALDFPALAALCDVFFPRVWLRRARRVPAGTVSLTIYFHADSAQLAAQGEKHLLGQADAQAFRNGFFDQSAQIWDSAGQLLATSHQTVYYKE
ncbi:MAG: thioesterase family protein [Acidovorax sp.]|jgi:acyl-CoA thioesterase|nr:thioesterase family protein [Acidovorax sp.]